MQTGMLFQQESDNCLDGFKKWIICNLKVNCQSYINKENKTH